MCSITTPRTASKAPGKSKVAPIVKKPSPPPPPPGLLPSAYTLTYDATPATLTTAFNTLKAKNAYKNMKFAIADLTGAKPVYLGHKDTDQIFIASTTKLAVMYAALSLRYTVRQNAKTMDAADGADLLSKLHTKWTADPRPFGTRFQSQPWPPKLANIFTASGSKALGWKIDFTADRDYSAGPNRNTALGVLAPFHNKSLTTLNGIGFRDRIELMIGWSDNNATGSCVNALGYDFLNGSFESAGFYDRHPTNGGGLWISRNYAGNNMGSDFQGASAQSGTAKSLVKLMVLAATKKLYDSVGNDDFLMISDNITYWAPNQIGSNILDGIRSKGYSVTVCNCKLGYANGYYSEVANISMNVNGKDLKYVIGISYGTSSAALENLSGDLAKLIADAHP